MSDILKCNEPITKPNDLKEYKKDEDLFNLEKLNDYRRTNIFKWFLLFIQIILIAFFTALFLYKVITVKTLQAYLVSQISNNIIFVVLSILAILKIQIPNYYNN